MLNPRCNVLLDQLTDAESQQVFPSLRLVSLTEGQLLYAPGDLIDQIYFPVTALVAIAKIMQGGLAMDVATVGKEGGIGFRGLVSRCPNRVYLCDLGRSGLSDQPAAASAHPRSLTQPNADRTAVRVRHMAQPHVCAGHPQGI